MWLATAIKMTKEQRLQKIAEILLRYLKNNSCVCCVAKKIDTFYIINKKIKNNEKNLKEFQEKKIKFVKKYSALIKQVYEGQLKNLQSKLVRLARKQLEYSPKTVDCDICSGLYHTFERIANLNK